MIRKPGKGWVRVSQMTPVYSHESGLRVHTWGIVSFPNGKRLFGNRYPDYIGLDRAMRIAGGNRRRAVMIWALEEAAKGADRE